MRYLEIDRSMPIFNRLTLEFILLKIKTLVSSFFWSIQLIDAVGDVKSVVGMTIVDLEKYCDKSERGYITNIDTIIKLARACDDIIDIVIVGCLENDFIPKAYKDENWEDMCDVIISREDSSLWQLNSKDNRITREFYSLIE